MLSAIVFGLLVSVCFGSNSTGLPSTSLGFYTLLADDTVPGYTSSDNWQPQLPHYLQAGSNTLFFTFINPGNMKVPPSFTNLAKTKGTGASGAVPANTVIMFSVGGESYSNNPNPWPWLTSVSAAESMAQQVAGWANLGADGIDLDIETGAGDAANVGPNLIAFIQKLKQLNPNFIVTQPTYGYPQVAAEIYVINHSWDVNGKVLGFADALGIMVYTDTQSLQYVKNYADGSHQWQGFPITIDAPTKAIFCGIQGNAGDSAISSLAQAIKSQNLRGIMVWYASVLDSKTGKTAFTYSGDDASPAASSAWANAMSIME